LLVVKGEKRLEKLRTMNNFLLISREALN
jgi:hypothetical protein